MRQSCELAIIGAGPYGISLAAQLRARGVDYRIFGRPMGTWAEHMPKNMTLKSEGFASNLSGPTADSTIEAWCKRNGVAYDDREIPVELDNFLSYTADFRRRFVPDIEDKQVTKLARGNDCFLLWLDNGEEVVAKNVVLAVGVSWYAYTPPALASLQPDILSHSYEHREVSQFRGQDVGIVGTGSSAIDLAHLLRMEGANPHIIGRASAMEYNVVPAPNRHTILYKLQNPPSTIGRGWKSYFCAQAPLAFYRLPRSMKIRGIAMHMHAAGGWFMREQVEGVIPMTLGVTLAGSRRGRDGRAQLNLRDRDGSQETRSFDHVIAATGYRVDMKKVPFLTESLRNKIELVEGTGSPFTSDNFETSVPGLYAIGLTAMEMFGPLLRFMVGAEFVAPRLASHLERKLRSTLRQAA